MVVNPNRFPTVNEADARAFADHLVSPASQAAIATVDLDQDGRPDFFTGRGGR
jgi:ABC-type tungstate transport system permease subunit